MENKQSWFTVRVWAILILVVLVGISWRLGVIITYLQRIIELLEKGF